MGGVISGLVSLAQQRLFFLVQSLLAGLAMVRSSRISVSLAALLLCQCTSLYNAPPSELISYQRFDRIYLYRPQAHASHLALLLSGDGGWSATLGSVAKRLAAGGTLVAGIDVRHLLASLAQDPASCVSPGAELEALARYLQQRYATGGGAPTLIGHSAGATLAFVALAQSAPGAFAGAITLSFCADLDLSKPLCPDPGAVPLPRSGGVRLQAPAALPAPWMALHGLDDDVCPPEDSRAFAAAIPGAHFMALPGIDHGYRDIDRWWPQFEAAYRQIVR